ncbi:MAG: hypothetical protein V4598_05615 [Bdellovibrionota bacterium]
MIELSRTPEGYFALYQPKGGSRLPHHLFLELLKYLRSRFTAFFEPFHFGEQPAWVFNATETNLKTAIEQFLQNTQEYV